MANLEYTVGSESHSSYWGKFYVKGLEQWEVKEGGEWTKHTSYAELVAETPDEKMFTVFNQSGNKRGTKNFTFYLCETRSAGNTLSNRITGGCYGDTAEIHGNFMILCRGEGKIKAPRLMDWWIKRVEKCAVWKNEETGLLKKGTLQRFAFWCAEHIEKRGLKDLPPMPADYNPPVMGGQVEPVSPIELSLS